MNKLKHILSADQFTDFAYLQKLFAAAQKFEKENGKLYDILRGKVVACIFYEPSTRTRLSFESAVLRLGGRVISAESGKDNLSVVKGESFDDTVRIISQYVDALVLRHSEGGAADAAAKVSEVPVINAGDGGNEHPTQALLDVYTIWKEKGTLENLHVAFGFDPKHSRTIRSLALILSHFKGNRFTFISPKNLRASSEIIEKIKTNGAAVEEIVELEPGLEADIFYANRLQGERFADKAEFEKHRRDLIITADKVKGKKVLLMDPLPRIDEIEVAVDKLPNALYFRQAKNGMYVRMALLQDLLG